MRGRRLAAPLAAALAVAGCGGSQPEPKAAPLFSYDAGRALAVVDVGRVNERYPIAIRDISYAVPGGRVQAYLVDPPGSTRRAGVVYLHGSGGDRRDLLVPATWLAARGAVSLAILAPSRTAASRPGRSPLDALRRQRTLAERDVVAVRRAVDLLTARPDVDPHRIGFVGWSAGARTGALVAGVEPRIRAAVLMSGGATPVAEYVAAAPAAIRAAMRRILGQIDPLRLIRRARPGTLLLQDGRRDEVVPRAALQALARAAPRATDVRWYPAGHALDARAYREQLDWLTRKLRIRGPAVPGAATGP